MLCRAKPFDISVYGGGVRIPAPPHRSPVAVSRERVQRAHHLQARVGLLCGSLHTLGLLGRRPRAACTARQRESGTQRSWPATVCATASPAVIAPQPILVARAWRGEQGKQGGVHSLAEPSKPFMSPQRHRDTSWGNEG